jgi:hypothetical protein
MKLFKSGLYICKTYRWNISRGLMYPVLKLGYTLDIKKRMDYYNKEGVQYFLISFFPVKENVKRIEYDLKSQYFSDHFRMTNSEHMDFETGLFKYMHNSISECVKIKYKHDEKGLHNLKQIF